MNSECDEIALETSSFSIRNIAVFLLSIDIKFDEFLMIQNLMNILVFSQNMIAEI